MRELSAADSYLPLVEVWETPETPPYRDSS